MVKGIPPSMMPYRVYQDYQGYPANAVGATQMTKDIASYCYDTQKPNISKTFSYLTDDSKPSYTWPIIGTVVSAISLIALTAMKKGRP